MQSSKKNHPEFFKIRNREHLYIGQCKWGQILLLLAMAILVAKMNRFGIEVFLVVFTIVNIFSTFGLSRSGVITKGTTTSPTFRKDEAKGNSFAAELDPMQVLD